MCLNNFSGILLKQMNSNKDILLERSKERAREKEKERERGRGWRRVPIDCQLDHPIRRGLHGQFQPRGLQGGGATAGAAAAAPPAAATGDGGTKRRREG